MSRTPADPTAETPDAAAGSPASAEAGATPGTEAARSAQDTRDGREAGTETSPPAEGSGTAPETSDRAPALRVVAGRPDATELAVLTLVLGSLGGGEPETPAPRSRWASPRRALGGAALGWGR